MRKNDSKFMKTIIMLILCGVFAFLNTHNFVEFLGVYIASSLVGGFVLFAFQEKQKKKEEPPSDIKEVIEALRLIEDVAYNSIKHDDIRFRKGVYSREVEGLGIVSVEVYRREIIRQIFSSGEDIKNARWISGWLARHRDENWQVHEIDSETYELILSTD